MTIQPDAQQLRRRAHALIPGGSHTYSKGDDQFPSNAPPFLVRGWGCRVADVEGRQYIEYGMGLRSVTLGHAFEPVIEAVSRAMRNGCNFTRPSTLELQCAEHLVQLWDEPLMVKFGKNGSDAVTAAIRLARAYTGRDYVACCSDQPFFAVDDWFIGTTPMQAGIPERVRGLTLGFHYNDMASVERLFAEQPGQIAALILEAATWCEPAPGFLDQLQACCRREGTLLILDEMITGFRWHLGGARSSYGLRPDLATYGKALGNGFAVSALVGRPDIMRLGGLDHSDPRVFLLSYTHGAESTGLAAAMATIEAYQQLPVIETMYRQGQKLRDGIESITKELGLERYFVLQGRSCNLVFAAYGPDGERSQAFRTLFLQEMIQGGILGPSFVISYAHDDAAIDQTLDAVRGALVVYQRALTDGVDRYLQGPASKPVFRRYNA